MRGKVGMCSAGRHLQCFIMTKEWLDGSELKFDGKGTTPVHNSDGTKTDDKMNSDSDSPKPT